MKRFGSICMVLMMIAALIFIFPTLSFATCSNGIFNNGLHGLTIDINSAPFTTFANYSYGSVAYKKNGCAWYASARVNQLTGKGNTIWSGSSWYNSAGANLGFSKGTTLSTTNRALACYENHVTVVEGIVNGNILISEGSYSYDPYYGSSGGTPYGYCRIEVMSQYNLEHRDSAFIGYVYLPVALITNDTSAPVITSATVGNVTSTGYDVYVSATDNVGVTKIRIGTWHDNMHVDNAVWQETTSLNNGSATIHVSISDFGNAQNVTYHTNVYAYDAAGNYNVNGTRAGDPYINGILTSVWMTPQTNYSISAGDSVTLSFGADQPVDWYKHIIDMNTSIDAGGLVFASSTGGSTSITFNTPGYYKVFMGAWHVSGDMYTDPIYVSVLSSIEIGGSNNISLIRGETKQLTITTDPAEYDQSKLIWTSDQPEIVSVSNDGLVTAHHVSGNAVSITCKSPDGDVFDNVSFNIVSNIDDEKLVFYVDRVPASYYTVDGDGLIALIREPGDILNCDIGISFINDVQTYEIEYAVEEGNISLRNDSLVIEENTSVKNVIAAHIYDKYEDGSRGYEMCFPIKITVFKDIGGGIFTLPASLNLLGENAFEGVVAKKYILPTSLTELPQNSLAGIPRGSWIFFNSDTINPFYADEVLGLPSGEGRTEDYVWFDTGSFTYKYYEGDGALANYYYLAKQVPYHWSDWTTAVPASGIEFETKTQYRSRSINHESVYSDWGAWISNGSTPIQQTDLREVKTIAHDAVTETLYNYRRYRYLNTSDGKYYVTYGTNWADSHGYSGSWQYRGWGEKLPFYKNYDNVADAYGTQADHWWYEETQQNVISNAYTEYQYRTRTISTNTIYGNWLNWQDDAIQGSDELQVETRTLYRVKIYN